MEINFTGKLQVNFYDKFFFASLIDNFRYSVYYDQSCSCENILKDNEEEGEKCTQKCQDGEITLSCGGLETESVYHTGSNLPGSIQNLIIQESSEDRITVKFDAPVRNGSELSGYEIKAFVTKTFSNNLWTRSNKTWKVMKSQHKFDLSNLLPATTYNISIKSISGDFEGGFAHIEGKK